MWKVRVEIQGKGEERWAGEGGDGQQGLTTCFTALSPFQVTHSNWLIRKETTHMLPFLSDLQAPGKVTHSMSLFWSAENYSIALNVTNQSQLVSCVYWTGSYDSPLWSWSVSPHGLVDIWRRDPREKSNDGRKGYASKAGILNQGYCGDPWDPFKGTTGSHTAWALLGEQTSTHDLQVRHRDF